jgi:hypothetical protein
MIRRTTYHRDELQAAQFIMGAEEYVNHAWRERSKAMPSFAQPSTAWPFKRREAEATNVLRIKRHKP